jgi:hypothetical protein
MYKNDELYPSRHFSLTMPDGPDSKDLAKLLERLAGVIRELDVPLLDVVAITYDLVMNENDEFQPNFTVVVANGGDERLNGHV